MVQGNPQIYYYLKKYQDAPNSRVFAPLAEAYRKAGLIDEAIEIAREGVVANPSFVGGKVALARALFDKGVYIEVTEVLEPLVRDVPDNLVAQRLLADSYLLLNRPSDALNSFKMLLFFVPNDLELSKLIQELELNAYKDGSMVLENDPRLEHADEHEMRVWKWKVERLQSLLKAIGPKT